MSQPTVIYWPPCSGNEDRIAATQNIDQDNNVVINATDSNAPGIFKFNKIIRSVIISSPDNIAGATFTISGIGATINADGNPEVILGPIDEPITNINNSSEESTSIFSQINLITVTGAPATNVTIGFGQFGITDYVFCDTHRSVTPISSVSLQFIDRTNLEAKAYFSLNKPENPNIAQGGILEPFGTENGEYITFIPAFEVQGLSDTTTGASPILGPSTVVWARIRDADLGSTDSVYFTFLQQGVSS